MASTAKPTRNRYRVAEAKQQMVDKIGSDKVEIELESGTVISFPHPMFYSSALKKQLQALDENDADGFAEVLLGEEQYAKFIESGEDVEDLPFVLQQIREDTEDKLAGRKRPTQS